MLRSRTRVLAALLGLCGSLMATGVLAAQTQLRTPTDVQDDSAVAQSGASPPIAHVPETAADSQVPQPIPPWITHREELVAGLAVMATVAVAPLDHPIDSEIQESNWQRPSALHRVANDLAFLGGPGPFVVGGGFYIVGRLAGNTAAADVGLHVTESVLLSAAIAGLGKGISGCTLPDVKGKTGCQFWRGFHRGNGPYVSFPSGHTAAGFALASSLASEANWWNPKLGQYVTPVVYAAAGCIGLARMYQNVHWASDLPLGAFIGTWSGLTVVARAHARGKNRLERFLTSAGVVAATSTGPVLGWSVPAGGPSIER